MFKQDSRYVTRGVNSEIDIRLQLAVYKENEDAVGFYKKKGFKVIKERQNQDSGFVEYIMENLT